MKYAVEMGLRAMTYVQIVTQIGSCIQTLIEGDTCIHTHTER
jgi:hypothetical protein